MRNEAISDLIVSFYAAQPRRPSSRFDIPIRDRTLTAFPGGIGDTVVLTDLLRASAQCGQRVSIRCEDKVFRELMPFITLPIGLDRGPFVSAAELCYEFNLGNGHFIQRLRRAYNFEVEMLPRGFLHVSHLQRDERRIALHLEAGPWAQVQKQLIHPRAREVYPETLEALQALVASRKDLRFIEIGYSGSKLHGVEDLTGLSLSDSIKAIAACSTFVGINSGPLHIAAALGLRLVTIVNFPKAELIYLPVIKDVDIVNSQWLYPQSIVLHQEGEGPLVKRLSARTLNQALDGELYPFFSDRWLDLICEGSKRSKGG